MPESLFDFGRAAGEGAPHARVDAGEVGPSTVQLAPGNTETARELGAQLGLVEVTGRAQLEEQPAGIQRRPAAVRAWRQVRDKHMAVQVGVRCPTGAVKKSGGHKAACRQRRCRLTARQAAPDAGAPSLQVLEGGRGGFLVPGAYLRSDLVGTQGMRRLTDFGVEYVQS